MHLEQVRQAWTEVLGIPGLAAEENFFDAGGTSLLAARLRTRLEPVAGHELAVSFIFEFPTMNAQARALNGGAEALSTAVVKEQAARRQSAFHRFRNSAAPTQENSHSQAGLSNE